MLGDIVRRTSETMLAGPVSGRAMTDVRGSATIARLVDATLACLARDGYASLSIATVTAEAGLSRGAIFHHFDTKVDLVAAAAISFFEARRARIESLIASLDPDSLGPGERLDMLRREIEQGAVLHVEIMGALRSDGALLERVKRAWNPAWADESAIWSRLFPEAGERHHGLVAAALAVLQGLAIDAPLTKDRDDLAYRAFRDMLTRRLSPA